MKNLKLVSSYVILVVVVGAVTVLAAEIGLRLSGHVSTASVHTVSQADYDRIPGMFEPNQDVLEKPHPRLIHRVRINSLGYRGYDIAREKPPGVVRILCLGDSGTFGQFVDEDGTVSSYLEKFLRDEHFPVEVINGGVPGTTIVDQLLVLRRGMALQPDIVVLTFSENDITDLAAETPQYVALERNRHLKSRAGLKIFYELVRDTAVFNYFLKVKATWAARVREPTPASLQVQQADRVKEQYEAGWTIYSDHLDTMQQYLADQNVRFLFNAFPTHHRVGAITMRDEDMLAQLGRAETLARSKGIQTIEILPSFLRSGLGKEDLYLLPYDGHANKMAFRLQATALLPSVCDAVEEVIKRATTHGHGSQLHWGLCAGVE